MKSFLDIFSKYDEDIAACMMGVDQLLVDFDKGIQRAIKYNSSCYVLNEKMFVFAMVEKDTKRPYILFTDGDLLEHPKLIQGDRKRMKVYYLNPTEDIDKNELYNLLEQMRTKSKRF